MKATLQGATGPRLVLKLAVVREKKSMKFEESKQAGSIIIRLLETRLGADKAAAFKDVMAAYTHTDYKSVVLDISVVEFIDSSGLGAILSVLKQMQNGSELIIAGATDSVASMFKLTRMDRVFLMHKTAADVIALVP
jgi:anti-sigma B factor antagonist